ncbi:MAG: hypothetical protein Fues2KO_08310 [Fuerstiella sp.]
MRLTLRRTDSAKLCFPANYATPPIPAAFSLRPSATSAVELRMQQITKNRSLTAEAAEERRE